jgi:protein-disulfide isomerase
MKSVRLTCQAVCSLLLAASLATLGCHAQVPAAGTLPPEVARRVEILIRARTKIPPDYLLSIGPRTPSEVPGFDKIDVVVTADGQPSHPIAFLLSTDGKTLAQFNKYDISKDPKTIISGAGRPARGGSESAPVEIVVFDDLECPFCAKMHAQLFPALLDRYGNNVRIVYRDYPLTQHPWAMRAAVDANCVAAQSGPAYWQMVDYIHAHAADFGGEEKSVQKADDSLDKLALDEAAKDHLKKDELDACIKKQDVSAIKASMKLGDSLGVEATPVLFINGEKLEGAYPLEDVFRMVDGALMAEGKTPPPAYKPAPQAAPAAASGSAPASVKPGN